MGVGVGEEDRNSKEGEAAGEGMDCHPDVHTPPSQLWLWTLGVVLPPLPGLSPPRQLATMLTPEPQADGAPDTLGDASTSRRLTGRPFVWLFSLKEADFQGDAHRVCLGPHAPSPPCSRRAGRWGLFRLKTEGWSPASDSQGLGMGFIHHPW